MTPRKQKAAIIARLSLHYWRPDFSPEQARLIMEDYLDDLEKYSPADVDYACRQYRKGPNSEFFPKIGRLLEILNPPRPAWDLPESKLPKFRSPPQLTGPKPKLKSVAEILRESGHAAAAEKWTNRSAPQATNGSGSLT
jgi:hypothetical protein